MVIVKLSLVLLNDVRVQIDGTLDTFQLFLLLVSLVLLNDVRNEVVV